MEIIHACCCGLDVHAKTVVACLIKQGRKQMRTLLQSIRLKIGAATVAVITL